MNLAKKLKYTAYDTAMTTLVPNLMSFDTDKV